MGALGMISVFDVEEIGEQSLINECGMSEELALQVVDACTARAKVVAEEMQRERAEAEARQAEEGAVVDAVLGGGGTAGEPIVETDAQSEAAADSILGGSGTSQS